MPSVGKQPPNERSLIEQLAKQVPGVLYQYRLFPDGHSCFPYASEGILDIYEVTPQQVREDASAVFALLHPDDYERVAASIQESARNLTPWRCEYRVVLPRQGTRWRYGDARPQQLEDGSILWHGFITDTTARKEREAALQASSDEINDLYNKAPCGYHSLDANGLVVQINDTELAWLGYAREEMLGKVRMHDLLTQQSRAVFLENFPKFKERGWLHDLDLELVRKDGTILPVRISATAVTDKDGRYVMSRSVMYDMSERRHAEQIQLRLNRALQLLSKCNTALVHATDEAGLLDAICQLIVEVGGYRMAWIGYAEHDEGKQVRPVAQHGVENGYLSKARITWADTETGRGPTGTAIREGSTQVNQSFLSNPRTAAWRGAALQQGYQSSIALPLQGEKATLGALSIYAVEPDAFSEDEVQLLEELAADLAFGIAVLRTRNERNRMQEALRKSLESTIQAVAATVEMRDPYTAGHQRRVSQLAQAIAQEMHLPDDHIYALGLAASIHDLGKIRTPAELLSKPGRLTPLEFGIIKKHPQTGYDILKGIAFPWPIADWIRQHHERLDGSGYPQGLKGSEILLEARILAVADVLESMSSHRPYRPGFGLDAALEEITRHRGITYDAAVVDACLRLFRERRYTMPA